ncbi:MAG: GNAT family N-acetyltransferase [Chloroflexota bacterium]|nr:GNAT family N-acetyltransferase [Chloroflexota bacterium]
MIPGALVNLRAVERHDVPRIHRWLTDPAVMHGWGWSSPVRSLYDVARQVESWLEGESTTTFPAALVAESLAGDPVGLVILRSQRLEARSVDLSLLVDAACWGQGFGADILQTVLDACFDGWGVHRIGIQVEAGNTRALALYRRYGFREEGRLREAAFRDGQHTDILLHALLAAEWRVIGDCPAPPGS